MMAQGLFDAFHGDEAGGSGKPAENGGIEQHRSGHDQICFFRPPGGVGGGNIDGCPELDGIRRFGGIDDDNPVRAHPGGHIDHLQEGLIQDHHDIGVVHQGEGLDGFPAEAVGRDNRCSPTFRPEKRRGRDPFVALIVGRFCQDICGGNSPLPTPSVPSDFNALSLHLDLFPPVVLE